MGSWSVWALYTGVRNLDIKIKVSKTRLTFKKGDNASVLENAVYMYVLFMLPVAYPTSIRLCR